MNAMRNVAGLIYKEDAKVRKSVPHTICKCKGLIAWMLI